MDSAARGRLRGTAEDSQVVIGSGRQRSCLIQLGMDSEGESVVHFRKHFSLLGLRFRIKFCREYSSFIVGPSEEAMAMQRVADDRVAEFRVSLHREDLRPLGVQVALEANSSTQSTNGLVISSVDASDLVKQWNLENPQHLIEPGTVICEINGETEALAMVRQIRFAKHLKMLISRDLTAGQQRAFEAVVQFDSDQAAAVEAAISDIQCLAPEPCSICLDDMCSTDLQVVDLRRCGHRFHKRCIQKWLLSGFSQRCPLCNLAVVQ